MRLLTMFLLSAAFMGLVPAKCCLGQSTDDFLRGLIDEAPPHIRRLIDLGDVRFQIDDNKLQQVNRSALTEFQFQVEYRTSYRLSHLATEGRASLFVFPKRLSK